MDVFWIVFGLAAAIFLVFAAIRAVWVVPHERARNLERFGVYKETLKEGLKIVIPFADKLRPVIDLREQWLSIREQVITKDNVDLGINTVVYFKVYDPQKADYAVADYARGVEKLAGNMLRDVIGETTLQDALTAHDNDTGKLRETISGRVLDRLNTVTEGWGIKVKRVKIVTLDPPQAIKDAMESRQATILRAQGQAEAIKRVSAAIHEHASNADLLAYQYLQTLPELTKGDGSTVVLLPSELTNAIRSVGAAFGTPPPSAIVPPSPNGSQPPAKAAPDESQPDGKADGQQGTEGEQQAAGTA